MRDALGAARRQARAAFGDDRLMLERLIDRPRHIEVQVLADNEGGIIHLGERECSLQRRHQKLVEETPSPLLDQATRMRIGSSAVDAAQACGYRGAGTVEFIVSDAAPDTFFFLEMNTRLQVEHPVTELVTGLDLVEWQLRIAAGTSLPWSQDDVRSHGHAIEARVYAEDPARDFLPAGGRVLCYAEPSGDGVRVDSGIAPGTVVPAIYDPLLAKVIAHGADRAQALQRLDQALRGMTVLGVPLNIGFLRRLLADDDVRAGALDTGLVTRRLDELAASTVPDHVVVAAAMGHLITQQRAAVRSVFDLPGGWRIGEPAWTVLRLETGDGQRRDVRLRGSPAAADVLVGDGAMRTAHAFADGDVLLVEFAGRQRRYRVIEDNDVIWVGHQGAAWALRHQERLQASRHADASGGPVVSPLPGTVVAVAARAGTAVSAGQVLVVVEAMKMEHQIVAPVDGVVTSVTVSTGDKVEIEQTLLVIEGNDPGTSGARQGGSIP
jgi:acetyl-CoA/propionyl-CoA carboxylase biotin carboxyl carrier protein